MDTTEHKDGRATYSPEDNKLRLYVGRVPRDEYEALRAQGWTSTPKQDCDFVAVWTPDRRDTALDYAGIIEDEDQGPADRAADRAERFAGYREKRTAEACGHADRYETTPSAHGYQSAARAERSAARHDRVAARAVDAWSKAEYWQRRTAGVISHALYASRSDVRMGRIKELEAELRKREKSRLEWLDTWNAWEKAAQMTDAAQQFRVVSTLAGFLHTYDWQHPRPETITNAHIAKTGQSSLSTLLELVRNGYGSSDVTPTEACAMFFERYTTRPSLESDWILHLRLRISYENQMLEAQGGRAGLVEMIPGGWLRGGRHMGTGERQIVKVNKSPATGRVVSVLVQDSQPSTVNHYGNPYPDGVVKILSHTVKVERLAPDAYRPPSAEELAAFEAKQKAAKQAAKASAGPSCPLINPTEADAERLQALWNEHARAEHEARNKRNGYTLTEYKPSEILKTTQATYSHNSKGSYASAGTREVFAGGYECGIHYSASEKMRAKHGAPLFEVRRTSGGNYQASRVIVLLDKPQKPLPAAVWAQPFTLTAETVNA